MSASLNRACILGSLGADPELRYTPGGQAVCDLRIATNDRYKDKSSGEWKDATEWHSIVVWGATAENCVKYLHKGSQCYVEGKLQTRSWEDKETGKKRYKTEIRADSVQFLGGKPEDGGGSRRHGGQPEDPPDDAAGEPPPF